MILKKTERLGGYVLTVNMNGIGNCMDWLKKKKSNKEIVDDLSKLYLDNCRLSEDIKELYRKLELLIYPIEPLETKLIYCETFYDFTRKELKEKGFVLKGITKDKSQEIWVKYPPKDEIPKTC